MDNAHLISLWLTLKLAFITTTLLLIISLPLAWWLSHKKSIFKRVIEVVVSLPLVLPPTVLGFYLLLLLGPKGWIGGFMNSLGMDHLAFSFPGIVIGSLCYSLPFVVGPIKNSFESIPSAYLEVAESLGASSLDRFFSLILPLSKPGLVTACILGFAHTVGEFGVVLMIGGNIPGKTKVLSIALYDHVEALEFSKAHDLSLILVLISFFFLFFLYQFNSFKQGEKKWF